MLNDMIKYFTKKHLLVNLITIIVLVLGFFSWDWTNKEELPNITFNSIYITTSYSGASAEDVEFYVTKPIEEAVQGIDGLYKLSSTSSSGSSRIVIELNQTVKDVDKVVTEVQNQVATVDLPEEILVEPRIRVFETSKKAIIDIAIYNEDAPLLTVKQRSELQEIARSLESKLVSEPEIFELRRSGYLIEEINIEADPKKLQKYEISLPELAQEIQRNHVRSPSGTLKSGINEQVTVLANLDNKPALETIVVQGGFDSTPIKLKEVAKITDGFEEETSILKVNGREAIMFDVVKNSSYGILDSLEKVRKVTESFQKNNLEGTSFKVAFLDDESIDVKNRLSIVTNNGLFGFILILIILFIFLNKRSGFWVALGIPFTLCFTLFASYLMGYTINGVTLAAIIIVLGIVVDDAIIVAENITRKMNEGVPPLKAASEGTIEVIGPITASILTTCAAFIPLFFFTGRYGNFVKFIPPIIFLMLIASLIESFFLLPSHMTLFSKSNKPSREKAWIIKLENKYETLLKHLLKFRYLIFVFFIGLFILSGVLVKNHFKFVMFPDEESREIVLSGIVKDAKTSIETAKGIQDLEEFLRGYVGKEGIAIRTNIAQSRRGNTAFENQFRTTLEIVPPDKRNKSIDTLIKEITAYSSTLGNLDAIRFRKNRFGQDSGSVFEILIQENNDDKREELTKLLIKTLKENKELTNIEEDIIPTKKEHVLTYNQGQLKRLSVNPSNISSSLRTILNGRRLYTIFRNDEEIEVQLTVEDKYRSSIEGALSVPVGNNQNYLIPLKNLVEINEVSAKQVIRRFDQKRSSFVYADLKPGSLESPLTVAEYYENEVFPKLLSKFPSSQLKFQGEVIDTKESKADLTNSIVAVICLIFIVLAILFDSLVKPLRILLIIPFGIIGVIFAFYLHQKTTFGFYAAIGSLGMLGVVVNDAIVMLSKLDISKKDENENLIEFTAKIAKTRLRAIILTTLTTVAGVMPTAYGLGGKDAMLGDMMLSLSWGLLFGTFITLILTPCFYLFEKDIKRPFTSKKVLSTFILFFITFFLLQPTKIEAKNMPLTLNTFIQKALANDYTFHSYLIDQNKLKYNQDINVDYSEFITNISSSLDTDNDQLNSDHSITLSSLIPKRGQTFSGTYSFDENSTQESTFTFSFSQDIAQNAFGKATQLDKQIQGIKTEVSNYQIIEAYEDYLAELITLYYTWLRQFESVNLAKSSLVENEKVYKQILNREKKKIADKTDVSKLKLQLLAKQEQLLQYEQNYTKTTNKIKQALLVSQNVSLKPDSNIKLESLPKNYQSILIERQSNARSFQLLNLLKKQSSTELERLSRDLMPSVSLSSSIVQGDDLSAQIAASFEFLSNKTKDQANYELGKLNIKQVEINTKNTYNYLNQLLLNNFIELNTQTELIKIASEKKELAKLILDNESENYSYGKITLNDYITAVNRFDSSRFDLIDKQITYQQLITEWKRLTDTLIVNLEN